MRLRRILSIILVILTLTMTVFSTACSSWFREETIEDFVETFESDGTLLYKKRSYENEEGKIEYCYDVGGQESLDLPKEIYVPPYFKGVRVQNFGVAWRGETPFMSSIADDGVCPPLNNVERLYLSYLTTIARTSGTTRYVREAESPLGPFFDEGPREIFFPNCNYHYSGYEHLFQIRYIFHYNLESLIYIPNFRFESIKKNYKLLCKDSTDCALTFIEKYPDYEYEFKVIRANITFHFNYEESPNEDVFFINDFERGGKIENTPYEPTREGYKFKGWYKEPECVNAWDFEEDTLPAPEYYENGELKYVETCLYAKWEKN